MSINREAPDVEFECSNCEDSYDFKQLDVKEQEDKLAYLCPVCNETLYETTLNRTNTN